MGTDDQDPQGVPAAGGPGPPGAGAGPYAVTSSREHLAFCDHVAQTPDPGASADIPASPQKGARVAGWPAGASSLLVSCSPGQERACKAAHSVPKWTSYDHQNRRRPEHWPLPS